MKLSYVNGATLFVAGGWVALLFSSTVVTNPWVATPVLLVAYALSCIGLKRLAQPDVVIHPVVQFCCVLVVALFAFTTWGLVIDLVPLNVVSKGAPAGAKFLGFLLPAMTATFATTLLLVAPVTLLLRQHLWIPPVVALAMWVWVSGDWPVLRTGSTVSQSVLLLEQLSLGLITPLLLMMIGPRLRSKLLAPARPPRRLTE